MYDWQCALISSTLSLINGQLIQFSARKIDDNEMIQDSLPATEWAIEKWIFRAPATN